MQSISPEGSQSQVLREAIIKKRRYLQALLVLLLTVAVVFIIAYAKKMLDIDSCLDRGGAWDYQRDLCVSSRDQNQINECIKKGGQWNFDSRQCKFSKQVEK